MVPGGPSWRIRYPDSDYTAFLLPSAKDVYAGDITAAKQLHEAHIHLKKEKSVSVLSADSAVQSLRDYARVPVKASFAADKKHAKDNINTVTIVNSGRYTQAEVRFWWGFFFDPGPTDFKECCTISPVIVCDPSLHALYALNNLDNLT